MVWCFMEIPQGPRQQAKTTGHRVLDSPVVPFIHTTSVAGSQQQRHFPSTPSTMALSIVVLIRLWFNFNMIIYAKKKHSVCFFTKGSKFTFSTSSTQRATRADVIKNDWLWGATSALFVCLGPAARKFVVWGKWYQYSRELIQ